MPALTGKAVNTRQLVCGTSPRFTVRRKSCCLSEPGPVWQQYGPIMSMRQRLAAALSRGEQAVANRRRWSSSRLPAGLALPSALLVGLLFGALPIGRSHCRVPRGLLLCYRRLHLRTGCGPNAPGLRQLFGQSLPMVSTRWRSESEHAGDPAAQRRSVRPPTVTLLRHFFRARF